MYIELKNVSKKIKGIDILDDVSLRMESGKIYGFRGKNGSGKTMLMRAIAGLIKVTGTVDINGKILGKDEMFPPSIGILIENPSFISNYTGFENLKTLASIRERIDDNKIRQTLTEVGLEPDDKRTFKKYSLGMKQRLGLAVAFVSNPDLIILYEPVNGLDIEGVVFTMYDARTNLSLQVVENVKENLQQNIYKTIIPRNVRLAEAPSYGQPITLYDPRSTGAEAYRLLAEEVINREVE